MHLRRCCCILVLLIPLGLSRAADARQGMPPATVRAIDAVFAAYDSRESPGCAAAVVRDGRVVFEKGYGMADLQHGVPITPGSIFHVASISKQFTAMSIVLLAREGKLGLDDDIRTHLPEVPDLGHTITIRHLIHHTSGLRDQWQLLSLSGWRADDPKSEDDILWLVSRQRALNFVPGAEYLYSNTGYTLLGTIVRRVSGKTLREITGERLFTPLGMAQTHFHDDHTMIVPGRTSAYAPRGGRGGRGRGGGGPAAGRGGGVPRIDDFRISIPVFDNAGATSLFTTVRDLARWDANFLRPVAGDAAAHAQVIERGRLNDGTTIPYAFALTHGTHRGLPTIGHSGSDAGYRADFLRFPDERHAFVTLCNLSTANAGQLNRRMAEAVLGDRMAPAPARADAPSTPPSPGGGTAQGSPLDSAMLPRLAGLYLDRRSETLREVELRDGGALHLGTGGNAPRLIHQGNLEFVAGNDADARWRFVPAAAGDAGAAAAALVDVARATTFDRVGAPVTTPERIGELAGRYRSEELDVDWTVRAGDDGGLLLERRRLPVQPLRPVFEDGFAAGVGSLRFTRGADGRVDGFLLTSGRVRHIRFDRRP